MTDLPEWALTIRDEMAEEIDKWIGDMSTSPDIATAALTVALPLIAEHMAGVAERGGQDIAPTDAMPAGWMVATSYVAATIRQEAKAKNAE